MFETGIYKRNIVQWVTTKPPCLGTSTFVHVGFAQTAIIFFILIAGVVLSTIILIAEIMWYRWETQEATVFIK